MDRASLTNRDIAKSLDLWREYIDPDMAFSDDEFEAMTVEQRLALIAETFDVAFDAAVDAAVAEWRQDANAKASAD